MPSRQVSWEITTGQHRLFLKSILCDPLSQFCRRSACLTAAIHAAAACTDCQPLPGREAVMTPVAGLLCCGKFEHFNYCC